MPKSILIFRIGQLGDSLVALPAIRAVRNHFPGAQLTLLCDWHPGKSYVLGKDLFGDSGLLDGFLTYPVRPKGPNPLRKVADFASLLMQLRARRFDALIYLAPSGRTKAQEQRDYRFFKAAGIKELFGFNELTPELPVQPSFPLSRMSHEADYLLSRLTRSGIAAPPPNEGCMDLELSSQVHTEVQAWVDSLPSDGGRLWVGFGPGSKMPAKKWPLERYLEVGHSLIEKFDVWPVVFGGPEDFQAGASLLQAWQRGYNAAGELGLRQAAAALRRCEFYVGNDTGTMHLAVAAGTKCVAIFSARDWPGRWDPYGSGHKVLRASIDCEGCRLVECVQKNNECLARVSCGEVVAACEELLSGKSQALKLASGL